VLQQPNGLRFHQLVHHVTQYRPHSVEPLICVTDIRQACLVQKDLLNDEDRNRLGELRAGLHNSQTERDYLRREKEVDHSRVVVLL
jgi:hypothetical protein